MSAIVEQEKCRRWAHYFVFDSGLVTKDEHDQVDAVKPFPDHEYLRVILDCLLVSGHYMRPAEAEFAKKAGIEVAWLERLWEVGMFLVEKSRQIMATWLTCAYLLWRAKYHPHQLILVQSKREDDAANLVFNKDPVVARISFMEVGLPKHLQTLVLPKGATYGHLFFPNGSHIWAIPEGGDIIRSNTPSCIFSDEAAFQPEFGNSYAAARPSVDGGGQMICVSSAEPGAYGDLIEAT